jgi:hypothetical protein
MTRLVAATQLALIFPAAVFLTAVLVGLGDPPHYELANVAHRISGWFVARSWTLPLLLLALPFAAMIAGCGTLLYDWRGDATLRAHERCSLAMIPAPIATLLIAWATLSSIAILAIVILHMGAN